MKMLGLLFKRSMHRKTMSSLPGAHLYQGSAVMRKVYSGLGLSSPLCR